MSGISAGSVVPGPAVTVLLPPSTVVPLLLEVVVGELADVSIAAAAAATCGRPTRSPEAGELSFWPPSPDVPRAKPAPNRAVGFGESLSWAIFLSSGDMFRGLRLPCGFATVPVSGA